MSILKRITGTLIFAAGVQAALAIPLSYDIGSGSSVTANSGDPGLLISTSLVGGLGSNLFTLDNGQSKTFDFFRISTTEGAINGDDLTPKSVNAFLDFAVPNPNSGTTVNGQTYGVLSGLWGSIQYGKLVWSGPVFVTAADRTFQISLSDEVFNYGALWGTGKIGAVVEATVTQVSSQTPAPVPEGSATAGLLGLGLLAVAFSRRALKR